MCSNDRGLRSDNASFAPSTANITAKVRCTCLTFAGEVTIQVRALSASRAYPMNTTHVIPMKIPPSRSMFRIGNPKAIEKSGDILTNLYN